MSSLFTPPDDVLIFDVETTGLDPERDQIIELCCQVGLGPSRRIRTWRIRPEVPIRPEAEEVHGISMEELDGEPSFCECAEAFVPLFEAAGTVVGYNVEFDIKFLEADCRRNGIDLDLWGHKSVIDLYRLWRVHEQRRLADAHVRFVGTEPEGQHTADGDVRATAAVLDGMMKEFRLETSTWEELSTLCFPGRACWIGPSRHVQWQDGAATLTFGKHRGTALVDLAEKDPGYLRWISEQGSFPEHVKAIARKALAATDPKAFHTDLAGEYGWAPQEATGPLANGK